MPSTSVQRRVVAPIPAPAGPGVEVPGIARAL